MRTATQHPRLLNAQQSKRGSSGASKPTSLGMIALGTDKGSVSVWDLKRGALAHSLGEVSISRKPHGPLQQSTSS